MIEQFKTDDEANQQAMATVRRYLVKGDGQKIRLRLIDKGAKLNNVSAKLNTMNISNRLRAKPFDEVVYQEALLLATENQARNDQTTAKRMTELAGLLQKAPAKTKKIDGEYSPKKK